MKMTRRLTSEENRIVRAYIAMKCGATARKRKRGEVYMSSADDGTHLYVSSLPASEYKPAFPPSAGFTVIGPFYHVR